MPWPTDLTISNDSADRSLIIVQATNRHREGADSLLTKSNERTLDILSSPAIPLVPNNMVEIPDFNVQISSPSSFINKIDMSDMKYNVTYEEEEDEEMETKHLNTGQLRPS